MKKTNKPDWRDAPEWAGWLAQDYDGQWYWYQEQPIKGVSVFCSEGKFAKCHPENKKWKKTLEQRIS